MAASPRRRSPDADDRGGGSLTGGGPSQLGVIGSMRARDVSRPRPADLEEAERLVQVSYRPRSHTRPPLHAGGNGGSSPDAS